MNFIFFTLEQVDNQPINPSTVVSAFDITHIYLIAVLLSSKVKYLFDYMLSTMQSSVEGESKLADVVLIATQVSHPGLVKVVL